MLLLSPFHSVCLTSVSPLFHHLVFHTARHIEAIDVHRCLSCRHGSGILLEGSRVSAPRLFCLAPPSHLVKFWPCAVVSRMTRSGLGTQAALSLRLIAPLDIPFLIVVFCSCFWVCRFFRVFWLLFFCFFLVAVFCFLSWNGAIYTCTTNQVAFHSIGSTSSN